jgi:hypothetical protein
MKKWGKDTIIGVGLLTLCLLTTTANAALTLTAIANSAGYSLATFSDGFPNSGSVGPVGIGFPSTGGVLVSSYAAGVNAFFATDTNGQNYSGAILSSPTGLSAPSGITTVGSNIYQAEQGTGTIVQIDSHGNYIQTIVSGLPSATGLVTNPLNGHLFVSTPNFGVIYDVNPITHSAVPFKSVNFDGMTITADGSILYGANISTGSIQGYNTTTGALVYDSGFIAGGIDGSALGTGTLLGNIFVNTNNGTVVEVNLMTNAQTLIAQGGSRGDFVSVDPYNGSLLLTQTDRVVDLIPPSGGGFGPSTPEPTSLVIWGLGIVGVAIAACRKS